MLESRYAAALAVVLNTQAELRDYTYLALLITETRKRVKTAKTFQEAGILSFIQTVLTSPSSPPQLVSLALQLAEVGIQNLPPGHDHKEVSSRPPGHCPPTQPPSERPGGDAEENRQPGPETLQQILTVIEESLGRLCSNVNPHVTASLLSLVTSIHQQGERAADLGKTKARPDLGDTEARPDLGNTKARLAADPVLLDLLVNTLTQSSSYHVLNLAIQCFLCTLTTLTERAEQEEQGTGPSNTHVNYRKIRQNTILQYFGSVKNRTTLLSQLNYLVKKATNAELRQHLVEFIQGKLDDSFISAGAKEFSALMVEVCCGSVDQGALERLMSHPNPTLRLTVFHEIAKALHRDPSLGKYVKEYLDEIQATDLLLKFIVKPGVPEALAHHGLTKQVLGICAQRLKTTSDLEDASAEHAVKAVLKLIQSLSDLTKLSGELASVLEIVLKVLARFLGVSDGVKTACCDLLVSVFLHQEAVAAEGGEYVSVLGYSAVSAASSWQLKDSSIQGLCALLASRKYRLSERDKDIVKNVFLSSNSDKNVYVRTASYRLLTALVQQLQTSDSSAINVPAVQSDVQSAVDVSAVQSAVDESAVQSGVDMSTVYSAIEKTLVRDQEAIVRREAVDFVSAWVLTVPSQLLPGLGSLMLHILSKDFDWEVKLKTARFWVNLVQRVPQVDDLASVGLFTALPLGLADYERTVRAAFREVQGILEDKLDLVDHSLAKFKKMDIESVRPVRGQHPPEPEYLDEDVDEVIENIVEAEDADLVFNLKTSSLDRCPQVARLKRRSVLEYLEWRQHTEAQEAGEDKEDQDQDLESILEDIIHSCDKGLVEIIDCY